MILTHAWIEFTHSEQFDAFNLVTNHDFGNHAPNDYDNIIPDTTKHLNITSSVVRKKTGIDRLANPAFEIKD